MDSFFDRRLIFEFNLICFGRLVVGLWVGGSVADSSIADVPHKLTLSRFF